jgi:chorismate mutase
LDIDEWRIEIDRIDELLIELLNKRSICAIEIGRIKRQIGLPIYSPSREKEVIEHVTSRNGGPLDRAAVRRLFERIIDESRRIERVTVEKEIEQRARKQSAAKAVAKKKRKARG